MPISKADRVISSLEEWKQVAPPKSPHHWVEGRSAMEVARAWLAGGSWFPPEVSAVFDSHPSFDELTCWQAEPEARLRFDSFPGEPRNSDLVVHATDKYGDYLLAVEAKADEPYGETVSEAMTDALERRLQNPRSNGIARIDQLTSCLFRPRRKAGPRLAALRYQLLTATAAAIAEAQRKGCSRAVMLVHEFVTNKTLDENHARNATDLSTFLDRLTNGACTSVDAGCLYGPFSVPAAVEIELFVGKAVRTMRSLAT